MTNRGRKNTKARSFCFMLAIFMLSQYAGPASAQVACPNWSAKFDLIDDPALLQPLRAEQASGWANLIQQGVDQGVSVQQQIATAEQTIQQMQAAAARDRVIWSQVTSPPGPMPPVTAQFCASRSAGNANAATAVQCDEHLQQNGILGTEGTLDILRCHAGLGPNAAIPAQNSGGSDPLEPQPALGVSPTYDVALAQQNMSKRQQMVQSAVSNWSPPQQLVASAAPLDVTNLGDPFAVVADSAPTPVSDNDLPAPLSTHVAVDDSSSSDDWSYPVTDDAQIDAVSDSDSALTNFVNTPESDQSWSDEVADLAKEGISESGEVSETVVAAVDNAEAWAKFSSSDPSDQADGTLGVLQNFNSQFNTNPISNVITRNGLVIGGAESRATGDSLDAIDRTFSLDESPAEANADANAAFQAPTTFIQNNIPLVNSIQNASANLQADWHDIQNKVQTTVGQFMNFVSGCKESLFGGNTCE